MQLFNTSCITLFTLNSWAGIVLFTTSPLRAEIIPDSSLPQNSNVTKSGNTNIINNGSQVETNLFHSFERFSIPTGTAAHFNNNLDIQNIITRVTGDNFSQIDGLIRANGTANLFLLNPNGIILGNNAKLDIGGSFIATTADSLRFANGFEFFVNPQSQFAPPLLTIKTPIGLQLGKRSTNSVVNAGNLTVNPSQNISLLGSGMINFGRLQAPGGEIALISVPSSTDVELGSNGQVTGLRLINPQQATTQISTLPQFLTNISATPLNFSIPNTTGTTINNGTIDVSGETGGTVKILGHQVALDVDAIANASGSNGGGRIFIGGNPQGKGSLLNADATFISSQAQINANAIASGNGGEIFVWSNNSTRSYGTLEAKGGSFGGNGGFIETSSGNFLDVAGITVDASANAGDGGTWLLDPRNVELAYIDTSNGSFNGENPNIFAPTSDNAVVNIPDIEAQLNGGTSVIISTENTGNQEGNITANGFGITKTTPTPVSLTLLAANNIDLDGFGINSQDGALSLILNAGGNITLENGGIQTSGGEFRATAGGKVAIQNLGIQTDGGEFFARAEDALSILDAGVESNNSSNMDAAPMQLVAQEISLSGAGFKSSTGGDGNAANLRVETQGDLTIKDAGIESLTTGNGQAGDIQITADRIQQQQNAGIGSSTEGEGDAGNVNISSRIIDVLNSSGIKSYSLGGGNAGIINIKTDILTVGNEAGINTDTGLVREQGQIKRENNSGDGGTIDINALQIFITENAGITSETASRGNGGIIRLQTDELELRNNANITTSTFDEQATGDAGLIEINAKSVLFDNDFAGVNSGLGSATRGSGKGGTIILNANDVQMRNRGGIGVSTDADGDAGTLLLTANTLTIENAGITSEDRGTGKGGNLNFNIKGDMILRNASISVSARNNQTNPNQNNQTTAGNVDINARSLFLENSFIEGTSTSGNGGNINLTIQDLLSLQRNSTITTTAGSDRTDGDGGNIGINAKFIVAYPQANSDITANAFAGRGGNVDITTQGLFNIRPRSSQTPKNDITASSELGVQGQVIITQPEVQPSQGLVELPNNLVDISDQIGQICPKGMNAKPLGEFFITGKGGLPPTPLELLTGTSYLGELATLEATSKNESIESQIHPSTDLEKDSTIIEAQGWVRTPDGQIILVANLPQAGQVGASRLSNCLVAQ